MIVCQLTWLLRIIFVLFFNLNQIFLLFILSCTLKDGKELLAEVLLLILGLWIRIISSLFLGLEPLLRTSILHPLAYEVDLFICPTCLGLLLIPLLFLLRRVIFILLKLPG